MHLRLCFASVAVVIGVCAQTPAPASSSQAQPPPIKVQVNEVIVPVTVTDEKGRFVSDLDKSDFRIYDEGKEQNIRFFTRERNQPVVVGFLMDMSNASRLQWSHYQDAAIELALNLLPGDKKFSGYLISYSNDAELSVNTTSDPEPIVEKLRKMKPGGGARWTWSRSFRTAGSRLVERSTRSRGLPAKMTKYSVSCSRV